MKTIKITFIFALLFMIVGVNCVNVQGSSTDLKILFTHDLHDRFLPTKTSTGESGGFERISTLLDQERDSATGAVVTLDGGDFSMGSLFQTIYNTNAPALQLMGMMGYDVTTLGNHEFDFRQAGFAQMLNSAVDSGNVLPQIVSSNYKPPVTASNTIEAWNKYGIKEYTMIENNGVKIAVFGLIGVSADKYAPMSDMEFENMVDSANRVIDKINKDEEADYVVCLSHAGTKKGEGEDYELAQAVNGIDVIISGHTHSTLKTPIEVNGTLIVSAGEYGKNLGVLNINEAGLVDYKLIAVDETIEKDSNITTAIAGFKEIVENEYLASYDMTFDEVLATNSIDFTLTSKEKSSQREDALGNLIADSYIHEVKLVEGSDYIPVDFAIIPAGVIRDRFTTGDITVTNAFDVLSLGIGADGTPGYPLVSAYITGKELKDAFEVDASVTPIMGVAQLWGSGMSWSFNPNRMIFNKVTECHQVLPDGTTKDIVDDQLYRIVTGLYTVQMLGSVKEQSFGILEIVPKDENGNVITNFEDYIIQDKNGSEVKEWYALANYLKTMGDVSDKYADGLDRKVINASWNPVELLKNMNWITGVALAIVIIVVAIVSFVVVVIVKKVVRIFVPKTKVDGFTNE